MKAIFNFTLLSLLILTFTSCTKEDVPEEAVVNFVIDHVVDEQALVGDTPFTYTNQAGNPYMVSALSYLITNAVLIDQSFNEVELINSDAIGLSGGRLSAVTLPNGTYKTMRITVSSFLHQGKFLDGSDAEQSINIDNTGTGAEETIEIAVGGLTVNGAAKTAYLTFNLNALYDAATDFNNGATEAEVTPNFRSAFSFAGSYENK